MSWVAGILNELGYTNIICIDANQSELTDKLKEKWLKVIIGHGKQKIQLGDVIIYSEATAECEEVLEARKIMKANKKVMVILNYFQFLGEISKYFSTIGFTGTNGKSSSTALAIHTAKKLVPNFGLGILWALVQWFKTQSYLINKQAKPDIKNIFDYIFTGKKLDYTNIKKRSFFVEACEYKRHFLHLDVDYAIITSLELDHTDYYKDMKDYLSAFEAFISKVKYKVFLPKELKTHSASFEKIITSPIVKQVPIKKITFTHIRGKHNDLNGSLVTELISTISKQTKTKIHETMKTFGGLRRRMEYLGKNAQRAKIFTDYGHMASSIEFGYLALHQKFPDKKIFGIFQPHQINRIVTWRDDFIHATKAYDKTIIYDIYAARENLAELTKKIPALKDITTLKSLGNKFAKACGWIYRENFEQIIKDIESAAKDTIIVIYSAGDIDYTLRKYLGK